MERLGIVVTVEGTLEASNGLKLTGQGANQLGRELDSLNTKTTNTAQTQGTLATANEKVGTTGQGAARGVAQLGRELAQGDYAGAAMKVGQLAAETGVLTGGLGLAGTAAGVAAVAVAALGYAAYQGAEQERALNDSLILTGNYAGLVAGQLDVMASSVARGVGGTVGNSREVLAGLTATGKFTTLSLQEVAAAAQMVARFTGQTNEQVVKQFAGMADGAANWAAKQNESYHFLSFAQYKHIELLEQQGRKQDAMRESSEALSAHLGGNLANNLGTLQKAWLGVQTMASSAWNAMLGLGRTETVDERISAATQALERAERRLQAARRTGQLAGGSGAQDAVTAASDALSQAESDKRQERMLVQRRSEQQQRDAQLIAADREKKKSGGGGGRAPVDPELEAQRRVLAEDAGLSGSFAADWDRLTEVYKKNGLTLEWLTEAQAKLLAKQPGIREENQRQAQALRELTQSRERIAQQIERDYANQERELDGLAKTNAGLREQAEQVGKTKEQLGFMKAARLDALIAQERESLVVAQSTDVGERQLELMRRKISLLEQQRDATENLTARTAAADARTAEANAKKAQEDESRRFGETIRSDLKNGLIRGFEAGKSPARALADTMGSMIKQRLMSAFADSILNTLQPMMNQVMGSVRMAGGGGGLGGVLGGVLGGIFGPSASTGFFAEGGSAVGGLGMGTFHTGGILGGKPPGTRMVGGEVFSGAPRFHTGGILGDEVPFIGKRGEGVFTPEQMAALAPAASSGGTVQVNIYNQTDAKVQTRQRQNADGGISMDVVITQLEDALADRVSAGTGSMFGAMSSRFGLTTAVR